MNHLTIILCICWVHSLGQIKEKHVEFFEPMSSKPVLSFHISYDKNGNILKQIQKLKNQGDYTTATDTYTYNSAGQKIGLTFTEKRNGFPEIKRTYTYRYSNQRYEESDEAGTKIFYLDDKDNLQREEYLNKAGVKESFTSYEYDTKGRLSKKEKKSTTGPDNYILSLYTYVDSVNQRIEHHEYTTTDSIKTIKDYLTELNLNNRPIKMECLTDSTTEFFTYDEFGNEVNSKTFNKDNQLVRQRRSKYKYWK